jgi:hypothetical protein
MKYTIVLLFSIFNINYADLRMASTPKGNFVVQNSNGAIPFIPKLNAKYMEPSDFNYQGLKNQRENNYDNFLRSNIDNEQDNRDFNNEIGQDMLPFRTLEANSIDDNVITVNMGEKTLFPLRWNNPHSSECEINIWIKSGNNDVVVPLKKPSCCGEGYQDNVIDFIVPKDFNQLPRRVPGFNGCNKIGDCTLQLYGHSVEPRTYAIGVPIIITNSSLPGNFNVVPRIESATVDPQLNLTVLQRDVCLPTTSEQSHKISAVPRFARLVSDQFNHAYQNSDYSPYSGQQHELISRNLQSATILKMTAANGGELGISILDNDDKNYITTLINNVNIIVQKYEVNANNIFNKIKTQYQIPSMLGQQKLATCFRCSDTGSVNPQRIEQQTYIPSFTIDDYNMANQIRNNLPNNVKNLIPVNSQSVQIYYAALNELQDEFVNAEARGFVYQPAMLKTTITTMNDPTNFLKVDENGKQDDGVYASTIASVVKSQNINKITNLFTPKYDPPPSPNPITVTSSRPSQITSSKSSLPSQITSSKSSLPSSSLTSLPTLPSTTHSPTTRTLTEIQMSLTDTLPPNPDDQQNKDMPTDICDLDENIINCSKPCTSQQSIKCIILCSNINNICNNNVNTANKSHIPILLLSIIVFISSLV